MLTRFVSVCCVLVLATGCDIKKAAEKAKADREAKKQAEQPQPAKKPELKRWSGKGSVTVMDYLSDWRGNRLAAEDEYKGKIVPLSGWCAKVGKSLTGVPQITLTGSSAFDIVVCYFERGEVEELKKVQTERAITIEGLCESMHVLKHCKIIYRKE